MTRTRRPRRPGTIARPHKSLRADRLSFDASGQLACVGGRVLIRTHRYGERGGHLKADPMTEGWEPKAWDYIAQAEDPCRDLPRARFDRWTESHGRDAAVYVLEGEAFADHLIEVRVLADTDPPDAIELIMIGREGSWDWPMLCAVEREADGECVWLAMCNGPASELEDQWKAIRDREEQYAIMQLEAERDRERELRDPCGPV